MDKAEASFLEPEYPTVHKTNWTNKINSLGNLAVRPFLIYPEWVKENPFFKKNNYINSKKGAKTIMNQTLKVELMTQEAFQPFGYVISRDPGTPLIKNTPPQFTSRMSFAVDDGQAEFVYAFLERKEFKFSALERHLKVTQGFFPMSHSPAIITVAPATDPNDLEALPSPDSVRAFLFESSHAFVIQRGVWHGTILPLEPRYAYILATRDKTTDESISPLYDGDVQIRDLGVIFELKL